ncbi:XRE family transcriptional regulator, partial [bacterium]
MGAVSTAWTRCPTDFRFIIGMEKPLASIRSWFRTIRSMYDLEQIEMAEILGISRSTLANYEKNYTPPMEVIQRTIDAFPLVPAVPLSSFNEEHPESAEKVKAANREFLGIGLELVAEAPSPAKVEILFAGDVPASSEWGDALSGTETIPISAKIGAGPDRFACRVVG